MKVDNNTLTPGITNSGLGGQAFGATSSIRASRGGPHSIKQSNMSQSERNNQKKFQQTFGGSTGPFQLNSLFYNRTSSFVYKNRDNFVIYIKIISSLIVKIRKIEIAQTFIDIFLLEENFQRM